MGKSAFSSDVRLWQRWARSGSPVIEGHISAAVGALSIYVVGVPWSDIASLLALSMLGTAEKVLELL